MHSTNVVFLIFSKINYLCNDTQTLSNTIMVNVSKYNGRVKCAKAYISYADNGVLRGYYLSTEDRFDEMGNQTYDYWYNAGEKYEDCRVMLRTSQFFYDEFGNITKELSKGPYNDVIVETQHIYNSKGYNIARFRDGVLVSTLTYNDNGQLIRRSFFEDDLIKLQNIKSYDQDGHLSEEYTLGKDGTKTNRHTFKYDNKGLLIEHFDEGDMKKTIYKYDNLGRQTSCLIYGKNNTPPASSSQILGGFVINAYDASRPAIENFNVLISSVEDTYDEKGNKVKTISFNVHTKRTSITYYKYNDYGNLTEVETSDNGHRSIYQYDENNHKHSRTDYNKKGEIIKSLLFDSYGNIVEEKFFDNNILQSARKIEIEYFC